MQALGVPSPPPGIEELLQSNHASATWPAGHGALLFLWQIDGGSTGEQAVDLLRFAGFEASSCYVALVALAEHGSAVSDSFSSSPFYTSLLAELTPRGLASPLVRIAPTSSSPSPCHVFVWNGRRAAPLSAAYALARGYKLLFAVESSSLGSFDRFTFVAHPNFSSSSSSSSSAASRRLTDGLARILLRRDRSELSGQVLGQLFGVGQSAADSVVVSSKVDEDAADNYDGSGGQSMKERLAKYVPLCSRVTDRLFLGSEKVAANRELLKANNITHVLNCAGTICLEYFPQDFVYKYYSLVDGKAEDVSCLLYDAIEWIEQVLEQPGTAIFIHCQQGISRSSTMLIAYLMWTHRTGRGFNEQLLFVKEHRDICNPNANFQCQLMGYLWKRITQLPPTASRLYRIQPHTIYSPELIVSKEVNLASLSSSSASSSSSSSSSSSVPLDPRGAFVLTTPQGNWIWIGKDCPPVLVDGARRWVARFQRYEGYPSNTAEVTQADTPPEFWAALGVAGQPPPAVTPQSGNDVAYGEVLTLCLEGRSLREEYRDKLRQELLSSGLDPTKNDNLSFDQAHSGGDDDKSDDRPAKKKAWLYQAPDWSLLEGFGIDDLESSELLCLVTEQEPKWRVFVWFGSDADTRPGSKKARSLAKACLAAADKHPRDYTVEVERDGKESDAFWSYF